MPPGFPRLSLSRWAALIRGSLENRICVQPSCSATASVPLRRYAPQVPHLEVPPRVKSIHSLDPGSSPAQETRSAAPVGPDESGPLAAPSARPPDIVCQLWCEQFKQLAWLGVTAAGGGLVLLQAGYLEASLRAGGAVMLFALAAAVALVGQDRLVDRITEGKDIGRGVRGFRLAASALLGVGAGALLSLLAG